jgi:hypothetical protein
MGGGTGGPSGRPWGGVTGGSRPTGAPAAPGDRLSGAPDGVLSCTTERAADTGKVQRRELQVADPEAGRSIREQIACCRSQQVPGAASAPADQAVRVSSGAQTGPWEALRQRLWAEVRDRGLEQPMMDLAVVAAGSPHMDPVVADELHLPGLHRTRILDIAHAQEHL